jgi:hypothetical protein
VLDDADAFVAIETEDGLQSTLIDLGAATGASAPEVNVVTVAGVTGLVEADFLFA